MTSKSELNAAIAIIGMSARYPGARDVQTLWKNVCNGTSSITRFTDADLLATGVSPAMLARPAYVRAAGVVDDIELFDAAFFGINPRGGVDGPSTPYFLSTHGTLSRAPAT